MHANSWNHNPAPVPFWYFVWRQKKRWLLQQESAMLDLAQCDALQKEMVLDIVRKQENDA